MLDVYCIIWSYFVMYLKLIDILTDWKLKQHPIFCFWINSTQPAWKVWGLLAPDISLILLPRQLEGIYLIYSGQNHTDGLFSYSCNLHRKYRRYNNFYWTYSRHYHRRKIHFIKFIYNVKSYFYSFEYGLKYSV